MPYALSYLLCVHTSCVLFSDTFDLTWRSCAQSSISSFAYEYARPSARFQCKYVYKRVFTPGHLFARMCNTDNLTYLFCCASLCCHFNDCVYSFVQCSICSVCCEKKRHTKQCCTCETKEEKKKNYSIFNSILLWRCVFVCCLCTERTEQINHFNRNKQIEPKSCRLRMNFITQKRCETVFKQKIFFQRCCS